VPSRRGFTLIELLIVVVIIGILAAIAIPKYDATKQQSYIASMKADLRNLVTAEEAYFDSNQSFDDPSDLVANSSYHPSAGNTVTAGAVMATGWTASMTSTYVPATATPHMCYVWLGNETPPFPGDSIEGSPACS
jgi:type IV pilus assembly protein PilA